MHVGIVTPRYPPTIAGGGEVSVALLAEQLQHSPRVDSVVVLSFDGRKTETRNGVEVRRLGEISSLITEWQNLRGALALRGELDQFDVVHGYNMELHPAIGALARDRPVGSVATLNSYHFLPKAAANVTPDFRNRLYELVGYPTTGRILRWYMQQIDSFIALSTTVKRIYTEYGFDPEQITVIPNMLDPSFSVPQRHSTDEFTVLYVGVLKTIKGVEYLIRAFDHLPKTYRLRIVGDGPQRDNLEALTRELGLTDSVTFVGYVDHERVPEQYAKADLFAHPCIWPEPLPRTIIEAMQASLPVVCTDVGGPTDIVSCADLRCQPGNPTELAETIEWARENATAVGRKNLEYVYDEYSPETVREKIVDQYEIVQSRSR